MYCPHCGKSNKEDGKFCIHCGKILSKNPVQSPYVASTKQETKPDSNQGADSKKIEKWKSSVKNAGLSAYGFGWLQIIVGSALFVWYILDKNFAESGLGGRFDASSFVLILFSAVIFIILGKRIKTLQDQRTNRYLYLLLVISIVLLALSLTSGGFTGIIFILMFISLVSGANNIGKLMKQESFRSGLTTPHHKINMWWWIGITLLAIIAFFIAALYVPDRSTSNNNTNQTNTNANVTVSESWAKYDSNKGDFSANLPIQPTYSTDSSKIENTDTTATTDSYDSTLPSGDSYLINVINYSGTVDFSNPKNNLQGALDGMVSSHVDNRLVSSQATTVDSYNALDYLIQNGTGYLKGRLIVKGQTLYQLMYVYEGVDYSETNYTKFIAGFELN